MIEVYEEIDWFDELALDPEAHPVAMGTRSLGDRPWLVSDDDRATELALKDELLRTKRDSVLYLTNESLEASVELARLTGTEPSPSSPSSDIHPLEHAARSVQEDLCLLTRRPDGWYLDASCLCAPTRWRLQEKVGLHITAVHGPVDEYDSRISSRVDRLFDQLTERPVWRRNWFLMSNTTLYQPDRPATETIIGRESIFDELYVRSERQTLRRLVEGWIVFTIRIQQQPLGALLTTPERVQKFGDWTRNVSPEFGRRRHLAKAQRAEMLAAFGSV